MESFFLEKFVPKIRRPLERDVACRRIESPFVRFRGLGPGCAGMAALVMMRDR
jgi:hypothetical protein